MNVRGIQLLLPETVARVRAMLSKGTFVDGKATAGVLSSGKSNKQLDRAASPDTDVIDKILIEAMRSCPTFVNATLPNRMTYPRYAKYEAGDGYPFHSDNPIMEAGGPMRTDISVSILLSKPNEYEGGELVIDVGSKYDLFKPPAGTAIVYPSGTEHRVNPVTDGTRLVAVLWIQSRVRDAHKRDMLNTLGDVSEELLQSGNERLARRTENLYGNLLRQWADV